MSSLFVNVVTLREPNAPAHGASSRLLHVLVFAGLAACGSSNPPATPALDASTGDVASDTSMKDGVVPTDVPSSDVGNDAPMPSDAPMPTDGGMPDWGFRPMTHGFTFENYTNMPVVANLTPVEMRRLFGPMVCEGGTATGACTLVPQARQWMEARNTGMSGGHCEGMAVLASNIFTGAVPAMPFGGAGASALTLMGNESLQREVALWFVTQITVPNERATLTPREVVEDLERNFARGRAYRGTVLGVYTSPGRGNGHAITPYLVRRPSATTAEILAYDNNYANQEKVVTVDLAANTFRYVTSTNPMEMPTIYAGDAATRTLTLADIEPRLMLPHQCTFCGDAEMMTGGGARGSVQVSLGGEGNLLITDGMGRTTGTDAMGNAVNTIPSATAASFRSRNLGLDSPEPVYTVPREGTLTLTLDGSRLGAMSESEVQIAGQGFTLDVDDINLDPMQRDTLTFRTDAPDITYRASGSETPTLSLAFQRPGADYLIEVRSGAFTAGQTLRIAVNFTTQRVRVSFDGSTSAPTFELYMERVADSGTAVFRHSGVTASATSILNVSYASWTGDGSTLRVEVDTNGDGTVDRMDDLSDEP